MQRPAAFQSGQCSSHAAFLVGRAGQLPCCFSSGQCSFSCLFGATGRWRCQVGGRHLPIVSYGQSYKQTYSDTGFSESSVFAHLDRIDSFHILSGRLSSNSCSADLICVFCATRRVRFFVSDLCQKRPSWRGRAGAGPLCLSKKKNGTFTYFSSRILLKLECETSC